MSQHRPGDADILIDGERRVLRLTLGALAELEESLGGGDFAALQSRLEKPRVADLLLILKALLQGGGANVSLEALKASDLDLAAASAAIAKAFRALAPSEAPSVTLRVTAPPVRECAHSNMRAVRREAGEQGNAFPPPPAGEASAKPTEGART